MKIFAHVKTPGEIILDYLNKKEISQSKLARKINERQQNLGRKLHAGDMVSSMIEKASEALEHNFYRDLADEYDREMRKNKTAEQLIEEPMVSYNKPTSPLDNYFEQLIERVLDKRK